MKTDLRVLKSRNAIENAFINLVEIKGFQNVTITEIADKAMVNRNTIYLNYGSKEDKNVLRTEILNGEDEILRLTYQVSDLEKRIRNEENRLLNPSK